MRKILLFFTFLAICSFNLVAQLEVDFSAGITEGCVPLTVNFTDISTSNGTITSWEWSFGNGNNSTQQNPTLIYSTAASTFEVCLTVTDDLAQTNTHCKTAFITTYGKPQISGNVVNVLCNGDSNGSIDITVTGGAEPYTFLWNDPGNQTSEDAIGLSAGTYSVFITDVNSCVSVENFIVEEPQPISFIYIDSSPISCFGACDGYYEIIGDGGWGNIYTYNWSNGSTTAFIEDLCVGDYIITITDENGCSNDWIYSQNDQPPVLVIEEETPVQHTSCIGTDDGAIDIIVTGGTPPYEYLWSNGAATEDISNLPAGVYTVTVTDANGCIHMVVKTVGDPIQISLTVAIINEITCGACNGSILAEANGGCGSYTYEWGNGTQGPEINLLCEGGLYSVTVTDCNGCTSESDIFMPDPPQPMALEFETTCPTVAIGGTIDLTVSGGSTPYTYFWYGGYSTEDLSDRDPGPYSVTVTDANGCTIEDFIELGDGIEDIIGEDSIYCDFAEVPLLVVAPDAISYNWTPADQLSCSDCPNPTLMSTSPGTQGLMVQIEESDGCIDEEYIVIQVQSYFDFALLFSDIQVFEGDSFELDCLAAPTSSVDWTGPNNFSTNECITVISNSNIDNDGIYELTLIDIYGCFGYAFLDVDVLTIIDSISENSTICAGGSVELLVVAPDAVSVMWTPAVGLDDPNILNPIASPSTTTTYTVTVEDGLGNQESLSVTISVEQEVDLQVIGDLEICEGGILSICANQNLQGTYLWTGPNGFATTEPCFIIFDLPVDMAGCYTMTYTSPNGCETTEAVCITIHEFPIITIGDLQICAGELVELDLNLPPGYTYLWSPALGLSCTECPNPIASPEVTTVYTVVVVDPSGCEAMASIEIEVEQDCVWPGDTDTSKVVDNFDLLNIGLAYDSVGPLRPDATIGWYGQPGPDWMQTHPGIDANFKHIDTNGDGTINANDTFAIIQNWGEFHNFTDDDPDAFLQAVNAPFYVEPDTLIEGESHILSVILGDMDDQIDELYGLAFSLEYDPEVIVPGSASMAFNDGWIGTKGIDMIVIQKTFISPGRVDVGITRIDGQNISGFGEIGQFYITIEDDILFQAEDDDSRGLESIDAKFQISNVRLINNMGEEIPVDPLETIAVVDELVGTKKIDWEQYIQIQPNPARDEFFITTKNIKLSKIDLYKLTGEWMLTQQTESSTMKIDTQNLVPGIYLLKVQTERGVMVEKVVVLR